jgi:hypothetical protein
MQTEAKLVDGHYQLPLPFRPRVVSMPSNRNQALQRANGLRKRFAADEKFHADYTNFMKTIIEKGYARKVLSSEHNSTVCDRQWYIPHQGAYHPQKPEKIRVVFDCSCQYMGTTLNKVLLQGPDLTSSLVGVLTRFRQEPIAIMADIESMFYQVRIPESQYDYLRFTWWPDGNTNADPEDYQMMVHLFAAVSSPSCANFALRKTAADDILKCGAETADILCKNVYVDDLLKSVKGVSEAINMVTAVQRMCHAGGFRLTKFASNNREELGTIPVPDRAKNVSNVDLSQSPLTVETALGIYWCIENDTLGFRITLKDKPLARRGVLSTVSSVYDPLGLVAPFLLKGKKLLQRLCSSHKDWDDEISDDERVLWEQWRRNLPLLEKIEVQRCFKPPDFGLVTSEELHHFSDASQIGYGQCSYLRLVDINNRIHCSLVIGKSRVSPAKPVTIPRLELTASTLSVKVSHMLEAELQYENLTSSYWTDSMAVLGYISNDARRFHTFVANRVQLIRDNSAVESWNYIDTDSNPADDASRGICCTNLPADHRWFRGPTFLWLPEEQWPRRASRRQPTFADGDPEVRKEIVTCATVAEQRGENVMNRLLKRYSSWYRLKRCIAYIILAFDVLHCRAKRVVARSMSNGVTTDDLQRAEIQILKHVQCREFCEETAALNLVRNKAKQTGIKRSSPLYPLNPFISANGLLCVGGRLQRSSLSAYEKHQIILPKKQPVTSLIIYQCHIVSGHSGKEFTLSLVRQKYWIIGARRGVRERLKGCITCRKCFSKPSVQKMADLPVARITPDKPPFTFVGVDFFGPFLV